MKLASIEFGTFEKGSAQGEVSELSRSIDEISSITYFDRSFENSNTFQRMLISNEASIFVMRSLALGLKHITIIIPRPCWPCVHHQDYSLWEQLYLFPPCSLVTYFGRSFKIGIGFNVSIWTTYCPNEECVPFQKHLKKSLDLTVWSRRPRPRPSHLPATSCSPPGSRSCRYTLCFSILT